jgi:hypothetical protein
MNTAEGIRRIRVAGKCVMFFGPLTIVTLWFLSYEFGNMLGGLLTQLFFFAMWPLCIGGAMWGIAWIVEGFLTSP